MARRLFYPQEKVKTCAVAAVRTVLAIQFDVRMPEAVLEALGQDAHSPIAEEGSGVEEMRRMISGASRAFNRRRPWTLNIRRRGTIARLRELTEQRPVICRMVEDDMLHMVVVLSVGSERIRVFDPKHPSQKPVRITFGSFMDRWTDASGYTWHATIGGG